MSLLVLDTDHITLLQRGDRNVAAKLARVTEDSVATSIVTYEEQLRGRLAVIRRSRTPAQLAVAYQRLREMHDFFSVIHIVDFNERAAEIYSDLRRMHSSIGTMDLRIAATVLAIEATLVTRNTADFSTLPGLALEDWST